jgi:hypothetical protein
MNFAIWAQAHHQARIGVMFAMSLVGLLYLAGCQPKSDALAGNPSGGQQ